MNLIATSVIWILRGWNARYSGGGNEERRRQEDKEREMEKMGAEGCAISSRMYATRVIPCDVYTRRSHRSLPSGNNVASGNVSEGVRSLIALNC